MNGPLLEPKEERDWVQTVVISGLEAGRGYECEFLSILVVEGRNCGEGRIGIAG